MASPTSDEEHACSFPAEKSVIHYHGRTAALPGTALTLYLDCDGVLADFDTAAEQVLGLHPRDFKQRHGRPHFWERLKGEPGFFANLPLMPDARILFSSLEHLEPTILTGCPPGGWAEPQKLDWVRRHFPGTSVITCLSPEKAVHCRPGDVLIDDTPTFSQHWRDAGGVFVLHTGAESSIRELSTLFLAPPAPSF